MPPKSIGMWLASAGAAITGAGKILPDTLAFVSTATGLTVAAAGGVVLALHQRQADLEQEWIEERLAQLVTSKESLLAHAEELRQALVQKPISVERVALDDALSAAEAQLEAADPHVDDVLATERLMKARRLVTRVDRELRFL